MPRQQSDSGAAERRIDHARARIGRQFSVSAFLFPFFCRGTVTVGALSVWERFLIATSGMEQLGYLAAVVVLHPSLGWL
jgi:hypothetical protein